MIARVDYADKSWLRRQVPRESGRYLIDWVTAIVIVTILLTIWSFVVTD